MNESLEAFIVEMSGIRKEKVTSEARLLYDLRITGDDAVELLIAYGKEFNVDVSNFMAADYFEPEGDPILPAIVRWITGKPNPIMKVLTVDDLEKGIIAGKLDEDIINS
jgi:acyl carrier protein